MDLKRRLDFFGSGIFLVSTCGILATLGLAQSAGAPTRFEVASIRPSSVTLPTRLPPKLKNGRLTAENVTLRAVLAVAFGLTENRVVGTELIDRNRFDILAKAPEGIPDTEIKPLLQSLLKDRFRLAFHPEMRQMQIYTLSVAKGGPKMSLYPEVPHPVVGYGRGSGATLRGTFTMSQLAASLSNFAGRPVLDSTSLLARYDIVLRFTPLVVPIFVSDEGVPHSDAAAFSAPDLLSAVREQLGLRLESGKANLGVIVVDHVDPLPSAN